MLGYGWSPKVEEEYSMELWGQQVIDFAAQVAGASASDRAVVAGNSIGALAALYAASVGNHLCRGICLVNSAGNFLPDAEPGPERKTLAQRVVADSQRDETRVEPTIGERVSEAFGRVAAGAIFYFTKVRIKQILQQVYEYEVDEELVRSIGMAAKDKGALGAFYQISLAGGRTTSKPAELLQSFQGSVMLLWGERDPWMTPNKAELIMTLRPDALYCPLLAGHCPQDDAPEESSEAIATWAASLPP
jgi:pimeloyl-ACP methyl ester carboxylesterase